MRKEVSSFQLSKLAALFSVALFAIDCLSKISLWKEQTRPDDLQSERGTIELSLDNSANKKIESVYFHFFSLYNKREFKDSNGLPDAIQTHKGELHSNSPYEINIPPGEYYALVLSGKDSINRHDLMFSFETYFGFYYESSKLLSNSLFNKSKCETKNQLVHQCQKIIVKNNEKTKIIIQVQKEIPIKTELSAGLVGSSRGIPIPVPRILVTRETPEVLIEVQNPK